MGSGVGMFIKNDIKFKILTTSNNFEQLWVDINILNKRYCIGVVYRPPDFSYDFFLTVLENTIAYDLTQADYLFCLGDFNINMLDFENNHVLAINNFMKGFGFCQVIEHPTRLSSLLDLAIVSDISLVINKGAIETKISDHDLIFINLSANVKCTPKVIKYRDYKNFNYELFILDLTSLPLFYIIEINNILFK